MKPSRRRLDVLLVEKKLAQSRQRALALILAGEVWVDGKRITKAGTLVPVDAAIQLRGGDIPYVSRGGVKLEAALRAFRIDVTGLTCLDVGASTGGFTDCLLKHGARHVTAVDVGYGQLHWKLRSDPRVKVIERTNIRHLDAGALPFPLDLACIDVSFISLKIVVPAVLKFVKRPGHIICLIKPQFEVGKGLVGKGGVVRDPALHEAVIQDLGRVFQGLDLHVVGVIPSPILGPKGNQEFLMYLQ
ncbi:MAG: TlyA family RNA methyltransferase [Deltaproteobacteria bacterium]|nr:TlyA family RNA methyltransferase [Deltaproteobacteria bacterium]MBW2020650.1 TlyA family RNA methyltransferase [Deltaproteobacteria bacterium]MBW2075436.1 TlyA family RNA methyltransferase [Deltaproteobacteria bacterium]